MVIEAGVITNWGRFGSSGGLADVAGAPKVTCDAGGSVAALAIQSAGLSVNTTNVGGDLGGLDIKRMDVKTAVSMSLMHTFATTDVLYEIVADTSGDIDFVEVGTGGGNLDVYYSVQTTSYGSPSTGVMVTGGKPLPEMKFGGWYSILDGTNNKVYDQLTMFNNCMKDNFKNWATIVYNDPHLTTEYSDGIDNLYQNTSPWEKVIGYVHYKEPPASVLARRDVKITWGNEASIPIRLAEGTGAISMGTIAELRKVDYTAGGGAGCFVGQGQAVNAANGVEVKIPDSWRYTSIRNVPQDKFIRISGVYLIGIRIDSLFYGPSESSVMHADPTTGNSVLWVSINKPGVNSFKLEEGRHYAVAYAEGKSNPYIVFAKETRPGDPFSYGTEMTFKLDPFCEYALSNPNAKTSGTIFPITKSEGLLVLDMWASVEIETPSITIFDPLGKADEIAKAFKYKVCPMSVLDLPAPIAYNGAQIDQSSMVKDNDPTTSQPLSTNTALEEAMDALQGSGMSVTWSFLSATQAETASTNLKGLLGHTVVETIYTCGPNSTPQLCGGLFGGFINAIRYSYTDQGSYTISVTVGPKITASSIVQVDGSSSPMMTEDFSARGVVIGSNGDNINFKVRIDGYGDRWAQSMTPHIIRVGDSVQCSVHNNPVEC
jgi:hypothetical protein